MFNPLMDGHLGQAEDYSSSAPNLNLVLRQGDVSPSLRLVFLGLFAPASA